MKKKLFLSLYLILCTLYFHHSAFSQGTVSWGTYYGGTDEDYGQGITTDANGNIFMAGETASFSGIASGGFQNSMAGGTFDAYLVKFNAAGMRQWATYYGGSGSDNAFGLSTDATGNVYMTGSTNSVTGMASGGFQNTAGGGYDAFLVKFNSAGARLWATYYGGNGTDYGYSVETDTNGNVYMVGYTNSTTNISLGGFQNTNGGGYDAFLVKFDSLGNRQWATYYGGTGTEYGLSVAVNSWGYVLISGQTASANAISSNGFQNAFGGSNDAFLAKFDGAGNRIWATYYGGSGDDNSFSVATDAAGNIFVGGNTDSPSAISAGGFQNAYGGGIYDAFLVKFDSSGARQWGTYYGGLDREEQYGLSCDAFGNVFLSGDSYSGNAIASGGFQNALVGLENQFVAAFDATGNRVCATYYGQVHDETGHVFADGSNVYLTGFTPSATGIATGGFQNTYGGGFSDAILIKFATCIVVPSPVANFFTADTLLCSGECISFSNLTLNATSWSWQFPGGTPSTSSQQSPQNICYFNAGSYDVMLIATNSVGSDTITLTNYIAVFPAPSAPAISQIGDTLFATPGFASYQWYHDSTLIAGATNYFYVATQDGNYNLIVTDSNGCNVGAGIINVIAELKEFGGRNSEFGIFPNPTRNEFTVYGLQFTVCEIEIYNSLGEKVYEKETGIRNRESVVINVSDFSSGIYLVKISSGENIMTKKIMIEI